MSKKKPPTKMWKKRHKVAKGDLVQFHSPISAYTGTIGQVLGYIKKNEVLVRSFGGSDNDMPPIVIGLDPRYWDLDAYNNLPNPEDYPNPYQRYFITRVIHRANPRPKKNKARQVHILDSHEAVRAALTGETLVDPKAHVVVALQQATEKVEAAREAQEGSA